MAKVLHIDNNAEILEYVRGFFDIRDKAAVRTGGEHLAITSHHFDGAEVPRALLMPPPDAMILDYKWGKDENGKEVTGVEFARKARAGGYSGPIVILSDAVETIKHSLEVQNINDLHFVDKSANPNILYDTVQKAIADSRKKQASSPPSPG